MITTEQLKTNIERFVKLQVASISSFKDNFPELKDWEDLLDFPKNGSVKVEKEQWEFHLHGCGLSFENTKGVLIDVHDNISDPELFDTWRILQYLESVGEVKEAELNFNELKDKLNTLASSGFLTKSTNKEEKYKVS